MNLVRFLSSLSRIMTFKSTKVVDDMAYSRSRIVSQPTMQICS